MDRDTDRETSLPDSAAELEQLRQENVELRRSVQRLEGLAYRDALTGLRNRRYLDERMEQELARHRRNRGEPLSVVVIDLDGFKGINDTLGHAAGDDALVRIARFLDLQVRLTDLCCRIGGDEFVLLLPETTERGCAVVVAHLRRAAAEALARGQDLPGFSLGAATAEPGERGQEILARADAAMYASKRSRSEARLHPVPSRPGSARQRSRSRGGRTLVGV
jgi:diguanylate cyclase (GGDEF)-like protein